MRPTLSLILQRLWRRAEPSLIWCLRLLPKQIRVILFRALADTLRIRGVSVGGEYGLVQGDPRDLAVITEYMLTGTYSPALTRTLLDWFIAAGSEGSFVDVGANIGLTTRPLAAAGIDCYCFEPDVNNFSWLAENTRQYSDRVKLFNFALFDKNDQLRFEVSDWNYGDHRVHMDGIGSGAFGEQHRKIIKIEARRLDDVLNEKTMKRPLAVKIDTQGAEAQVIRGGSRILAEVDLLSLEFCPYLIRRMGEHENALIEFVTAHFSVGVISNWHDHNFQYEWIAIKDLAGHLRSFSESAATTKHLDLLLKRN